MSERFDNLAKGEYPSVLAMLRATTDDDFAIEFLEHQLARAERERDELRKFVLEIRDDPDQSDAVRLLANYHVHGQ